LKHVRFRAAIHPILNYVEFRTNPKPYVVRGVVHGGLRIRGEEFKDARSRITLARPASAGAASRRQA
jgi:hypothetical protein